MGLGYITFFLDGSLTHKLAACESYENSEIYADNETWKPCMNTEEDFQNCSVDQSETQFVISQEAASCMLYSISHSPIGKLQLNTAKINEMFGLVRDQAYVLNSDTLGKHLSIFRNHIQQVTNLKIELSYGKPKVTFGNSWIKINYYLGMSIKEDKEDAEELFYDEIKMAT